MKKIFHLFPLCLFVFAQNTYAQIAPECAGVPIPADFDDEKQRIFMQNYFATSFIQTPLGPIIPYNKFSAGVSAELGFVPPLSCQQRLARFGEIKTEDTNKSPILPRIRLSATLPNAGPMSFALGLSFLPAIPLPFGQLFNLNGEFASAWQSNIGLGVGLRLHASMERVTTWVTLTKEESPDPDLFSASSLGIDLGLFYRIPYQSLRWMTPFISAGYAAVDSHFIVGSDTTVVTNKNPWHGALVAGGIQALLLNDHLEIALEVSSAIPIFTTVKAKIGYVW